MFYQNVGYILAGLNIFFLCLFNLQIPILHRNKKPWKTEFNSNEYKNSKWCREIVF